MTHRPFLPLALLVLAAALWSPPARAVLPDEMLADPALEARARYISKELRCLSSVAGQYGNDNATHANTTVVILKSPIMPRT